MSMAQSSVGEPLGRTAPVRELVNTFEYVVAAQR